MSLLSVTILENGTTVFERRLEGPIEFGRQQAGEPKPISIFEHGSGCRLIIADETQRTIPRKACLIRVDGSRIQLENLHEQNDLMMVGRSDLQPREQCSSDTRACFRFPGGYTIQVTLDQGAVPTHVPDPRDTGYRTLASIPLIPVTGGQLAGDAEAESFSAIQTGPAKSFIQLLRAALEVVQLSAASNGFFESAVRAAATSIGLDRVLVFLQTEGDWQAVAEFAHGQLRPTEHRDWSHSLVRQMCEDRRTVVFDPSRGASRLTGASLAGIQSSVASPMFDEKANIVGMLYGERALTIANEAATISDVDATLFEVFTGAIAGGLARQRESTARGQLEQFFSGNVAEQLRTNPQLLAGQDVEVTVLFCDIRGFSTVTEQLGPRKTIEWINDVLTELSECVLKQDGVLVDYVGDELLAMWGAPGEQPDHAARALQAAIDMLAQARPLQEKWSSAVPWPFSFGIGISTGNARVGNTGSRVKFKYGPLGNTVNLGSRVQGTTKHFRVKCVATESTVAAAGQFDRARRLATVQLLGIDEPVRLYEVVSEVTDEWRDLQKHYVAALDEFESGQFSKAAASLGLLVNHYPDDGPTLQLLGRAVANHVNPPRDFSPVLRLFEK
ncbi:MAG TPA: adenylate/guanylate cyclase domain-containing protein [Caulifigura sp.]|jgi:adenylate cyclase|nr:adenylate/guanylate cyclase domain-containing protein [Caulifigura sp.]